MCHDHDTGSELAVKQVEVGLLNSATQKVSSKSFDSLEIRIVNNNC